MTLHSINTKELQQFSIGSFLQEEQDKKRVVLYKADSYMDILNYYDEVSAGCFRCALPKYNLTEEQKRFHQQEGQGASIQEYQTLLRHKPLQTTKHNKAISKEPVVILLPNQQIIKETIKPYAHNDIYGKETYRFKEGPVQNPMFSGYVYERAPNYHNMRFGITLIAIPALTNSEKALQYNVREHAREEFYPETPNEEVSDLFRYVGSSLDLLVQALPRTFGQGSTQQNNATPCLHILDYKKHTPSLPKQITSKLKNSYDSFMFRIF